MQVWILLQLRRLTLCLTQLVDKCLDHTVNVKHKVHVRQLKDAKIGSRPYSAVCLMQFLNMGWYLLTECTKTVSGGGGGVMVRVSDLGSKGPG